MWHISILSFHMQEKKKESLANCLHINVVSYRTARAYAVPRDWSEIKLLRTPARKTILTLKNTLATLCLVKGYINSSFQKDKTISIQSKQIHL